MVRIIFSIFAVFINGFFLNESWGQDRSLSSYKTISNPMNSHFTTNEVLFELKGEVYTSFDERMFLLANTKTPLKLNLLKFAISEHELFIVSRLLLLQAQDNSEPVDKSKNNKTIDKSHFDFNKESDVIQIQQQNNQYINDSNYSKFKETFTADKYHMWTGYLKKKYNFIQLSF